MAHPSTIRRSLQKYAAHYKRAKTYPDIMEDDWKKAFRHTPDKLLEESITAVFKAEYPYRDPTLKDILDMVKYVGKGVVHSHKTGIQKCHDCQEHGFRYMAIHFMRGEKYTVQEWAVGCNCDLGKSLKCASFIEVEGQWKNRPDFIRSYITSAELPWLTSRETMSPKDWEAKQERMKSSKFRRRATAYVSQVQTLERKNLTWVEQQQKLLAKHGPGRS